MSCSSHIPENDQKVASKEVCNKRYYAENKEHILAQQKQWRTENVEILKARRKKWYEIDKERLVNNQRPYCQQNRNYRTLKTTGNGSTDTGKVIMPRLKNRSTKDFITKGKKKSYSPEPGV